MTSSANPLDESPEIVKYTLAELAPDQHRGRKMWSVMVSVKVKGSSNLPRVIRLPLVFEGQGPHQRSSVRVEVVGLSGDLPLANLTGQISLEPGTYTVTAPTMAHWTARLKITAHSTDPLILCPHAVAKPSESHTHLLKEDSDTLWRVQQTLVIRPCCRDRLRQPNEPNYTLALVHAVRGKVSYILNGRSGALSPNYYLLVNPTDAFQFDAHQPLPITLRTHIFFQPAIRAARESAGLPKDSGPFAFEATPRRLSPDLQGWLTAWDHPPIHLSPRGQHVWAKHLCQSVLLFLMGTHPNPWHQTFSGHSGPPVWDHRFQAAVALLHHHSGRPLSIPEIAKEAGVGESWLRKQFAANLGTNPKQYLQKIRMEKAAALLKNPKRTIEEVAHQVGYRNVQTFYRIFAAHTGSPPASHRSS